MDCLCLTDRKNSDSLKEFRKNVKKYRQTLLEITSPKLNAKGKPVEIRCNYILCENIVESGNEKNVIYGNNHYQFCSDKCWNDWLKSGNNLNHSAWNTPVSSPLMKPYSPEYLKFYKNDADTSKIPPLFI